jgi:hypothetical protein
MCFVAANATAKAAVPAVRRAGSRAPARRAFVEDLNWPAPAAPPDKKPRRPVEVWVPGPLGSWEGEVPRIQ